MYCRTRNDFSDDALRQTESHLFELNNDFPVNLIDSNSGRLHLKNLSNRLSDQFERSPLALDVNDFEINPEITFKETFYTDIESIFSKLSTPDQNFNILSLNIECINTKYDSLIAMIDLCKQNKIELSVISLQETWQTHIDYDLEIPGYNTFYLPKTCSMKGGLVSFVTK